MQKNSKKIIFKTNKIFLAIFILLLFSISVTGGVIKSGKFLQKNLKYVVVIDAGHGGMDGGVKGVKTGVYEREINLEMAKTLKKQFENKGVLVILTRKDSNGAYISPSGSFKTDDFEKRRDIINRAQPNLVISLHANYFGGQKSRRGAQVFYNKNSNASKFIAQQIQDNLNNAVNSLYSKRNFSALYGDYYILNCTIYPSVIVECGFLSNEEDEKLLISQQYKDLLCGEILKATINYLYLYDTPKLVQ